MRQVIFLVSFIAATAIDDGTVLLQTLDEGPERRLLYHTDDNSAERTEVRSIKTLAVARKAQYESMNRELADAEVQFKKVSDLSAKLSAERAAKTGEIDILNAFLNVTGQNLEAVESETEETKSSIEAKKDNLKRVPKALASIPRKTELLALQQAIDVRETEMSSLDAQLQKLQLDTKGYESKAPEEVAAEQRLVEAKKTTSASAEEKDLAAHQIELVAKETRRINELAAIMREWKPKADDKDQVGIAHRLLLSAGVENDAKDLQLEIVKIMSERSEAWNLRDTKAAHNRIQQLQGELELIEQQISEKDAMLGKLTGKIALEDIDLDEAPKLPHKKHRHHRSASLLQRKDSLAEDHEELKSIACGTVHACKKLLAGLDKKNEEMQGHLERRRKELSVSSQRLRLELGVAEREGRGLDSLSEKVAEKKATLKSESADLDRTSFALADMKKEFKVLQTELAISSTWANRLAHKKAPEGGGDFDMSFLETAAKTIVQENSALKAKAEEVADARKDLEDARRRSADKVAAIKAQTTAAEEETARNVQTAKDARAETLQRLKELNGAVEDYDKARVAAGSAIRAEPTMNKGLMKLSEIGYFASQDDQDKVDMLTEAWRMENHAMTEYMSKKDHLLSLMQEYEQRAAKGSVDLDAAASEVFSAASAAEAKRQELQAKTAQVDKAQDSRVQALYEAF